MEPRPSHDGDTRPDPEQTSAGDIDDEETELDSIAVADGFRSYPDPRPTLLPQTPTIPRPEPTSPDPNPSSPQESAPSNSLAPESLPQRSNSTRKAPLDNDTSHNDTSAGVPTTSSYQSPPSQPRRTLSYASTISNPRASSPYQGPSGPSHAYGLYTQGTGLERSASIATSVGVRGPERPLPPQNGPSHPYGMYPQDVFVDPDPAPVPIQQNIPLGFHAVSNHYHNQYNRRIGPEGEEQDIVGPDGHTEQLPPYTRYPEQTPPKTPSVPSVPSTTSTSSQVGDGQSITSRDPLVPPPGEPVTRVQPAATEREPGPPPGDPPEAEEPKIAEKSEKPWNDRTRTEKLTTRVCKGKMPIWVVMALVGVAIIIAAILGGVIGGLLSREKAVVRKFSASIPATVTVTASLYDASIIPSPSNFPAMPTGSFPLPLGIPEVKQQGCLMNTLQEPAWDCSIVGPKINIVLTNNTAMVQVDSINADAPTRYGAQAPVFPPQPLLVVQDLDEPYRGAAYYFNSTYDKLVILPGDTWSPVNLPTKRDVDFQGNWHGRSLSSGDKVWQCRWNQTFIEGFVYAQQDNPTSSSSMPAMTTNPVALTASSGSTSAGASASASAANATATSNSAASKTGVRILDWTPSITQSFQNVVPTGHAQHARADVSSSVNDSPYPKMMKVEERRISNEAYSYCQYMQVMNDMTMEPVPVGDGDSSQIRFDLAESDPTYITEPDADGNIASDSTSLSRRRRRAVVLRKRLDPPTSCHCQWRIY